MIITEENRYELIEQLASAWTDSMDIRDLESFFFEKQIEALEECSDEELLDLLKYNGMTDEEE